ncbi:DNA polymerase III subunit alpha [Sphingobacterium spiritivorum]|uniref:DNA-directed DNA polymerase n=1 Tax=Sphingobacterium spiritivorum ATCC 33861 TaxID=525373 RepID=D7VP45_SPHSI|nr:DNA polymerase III subunit alpha [Sphingobacterium spiritivorum]EFK57692.1 DNA polymerase III, alpha subunit [Sphingobacterium spiritivorum ATCC 33861]QQT36269.1 DNA polymerase III subunit alpha [Sphingobacterium spiritivorum]WQD33008.1 DNA polymerase III subunit alpha [Sphingobacterium spiritivorum]SUJ18275.1 DNA polymerase III subunit alpha [Sphingobacterium spiritivorum]
MYLNCKTWFSYHYGTFSSKQLVEDARALDIHTLALTNINNTADSWDFVLKCREQGIKPILGTEIRNDHVFCYILLARNETGLFQINQFLSAYNQRKENFPAEPELSTEHLWIIYRYGQKSVSALREGELIGLRPQDLNRLELQQDLAADRFVMLSPVTFQDRTYFNLHRLLRAIARNTLLSKLLPEDIAGSDEMLQSEVELVRQFARFPTVISRTIQVADSCHISMELKTDKNRKYFTTTEEDDRHLLRKLAMEGCVMRYGTEHKEAFERVEKELKMIGKQGFNAYFLIIWDILRYAHERGFYHVGRGSGANSIVAYCLRITDVDPIKLDLYFERFLNPDRSSPPDFDIDFSWKDRDAIFDYMFKRYGRQHVALLGMYSTFKRRAIIRELGKVFGLPKAEIDQLVAQREWRTEDKIQGWIHKYGQLLEHFPNHLSVHAGGVLISEKPICHYAAVELPPKDFQTIHMDMFEAERVGLFKFDILSQRGLGHIKDALQLIEENTGKHIDIHQVERFFEDPLLAEKIRSGDTIGCFYIESPAMRQLLGKLQCSDYLTLVAASSIIRPGVAQSGMMKQYIERYHDRDKVLYLHPKMKELLAETFGVMVYQEDVIKVAHHFAGISLDQADILRRAMSGKYRSENKFEKLRQTFFDNCRERGYEEQVTREVWRQMESFGGYSFAKGHSASFAVESYQSLFLKTYYPREFYVAVINNFGGFYRTEFYFQELFKTGAHVQLPCINHSQYYTNIVNDTVYVGLIHLQGLEEKFAHNIITERKKNGIYRDLNDFIARLSPGMEQLNLLIRIDALRFTGKNKKALLWEANFMTTRQQILEVSLFETPELDFQLPEFEEEPMEDYKDQLELMGFIVGDFFDLLDPKYLTDTVHVRDLVHLLGKEVSMIGRLVTIKETSTIRKERMVFGTFLDCNADWLDTVHFPVTLQYYPFLGNGFYQLTGKVVEEFGVYSLEVSRMKKIGYRF